MTNNTTENISESSASVIAVAYYAFSLIIVGTVLNLLTYVVLCRSKFKDTDEQPTLYYIRTVAIFDVLMLYGWNFDHYTLTIHGFQLPTYTIASCKYAQFLNYFTAQISAWLRVFICLDRYLSLSRLHRTWFGRPKSVLIIITCIISFFTLFNLHLIIFGCFYDATGSLNANSRLYTIYPMWDFVNLAMYNCLPFLLMVLFNSGVIYHLMRLRRTSTIQNSRIRHRAITITLVVTTFLFLIMTIPATVAFGFFGNTAGDIVLYTLDSILYTYHILSFPLYMITFTEFRREFIKMITCNRYGRRIAPQPATTTHQLTRT
ncbi:unnamed protein product [Adineta steineri]|uniref:G-protein coupled receptors family 1 profile domain-containing protein n=1 Tax=Adineta steineri TaxID=433720 RepID=A0A815U2Y2_9BILA|nr:unnamed protein product [Adineta steineri]CAF4023789.1 unnamed protein product [Adineta steineri]